MSLCYFLPRHCLLVKFLIGNFYTLFLAINLQLDLINLRFTFLIFTHFYTNQIGTRRMKICSITNKNIQKTNLSLIPILPTLFLFLVFLFFCNLYLKIQIHLWAFFFFASLIWNDLLAQKSTRFFWKRLRWGYMNFLLL